MPAANRYSLWLEPDGVAADALHAIIDRLAAEHGGPCFRPHLTLLGGIETTEAAVVAGAARLAATLAPLTLQLDDFGATETYFQALFATARPTTALLAARAAAEATFPEAPSTTYIPHVSLLYGHPEPATKQAIVDALRGTLPPSFVARILTVNTSGPDVAAWRSPLRTALTG